MGRYRKVDTRIWNDARFGILSDDAKLVFLFVLTHPHLTSLGAMRATVAGLAAELRWQSEQFGAAFDELVRADTTKERVLVEYDEQASFIGLPNFLKYNQPENPNVIKNWGTLFDLLPECEAKAKLIDRVERCVVDRGPSFVAAWEGVSETVCQTLSKGLPERSAKPARKGCGDLSPHPGNSMPNQEQEPEQEQKPKQEPSKKGAADAAVSVRKFRRPTLDQVTDYCRERNNKVNPGAFLDFYESKGWKIGNGPMKNWQAAVRNWERRESNGSGTGTAQGSAQRLGRVEAPPGKYDDDSNVIDLTEETGSAGET